MAECPRRLAPPSTRPTGPRVDADDDRAVDRGRPASEPKAALVYNPIKVDAAALRATVEKLVGEAGWAEPLFYETTVDDLGDEVDPAGARARASTRCWSPAATGRCAPSPRR